MTHDKTEMAKRGSQMWLQKLVNQSPGALNSLILAAIPSIAKQEINWVSPLEDEDYVEYRDGSFLDHLQIELATRPMNTFWPPRGPVWDGLAYTDKGEILLVEAKAHIAEAVSPPSRASPQSKKLIDEALAEVKEFLGGNTEVDWSGTFYQVTNRLAHLYLLRTLNDVPAHLVFVYFIGDKDMGGPETSEEWEGAIKIVESYLGISRHKLSPFVRHVFCDVATIPD